jgi:hypothetical protein
MRDRLVVHVPCAALVGLAADARAFTAVLRPGGVNLTAGAQAHKPPARLASGGYLIAPAVRPET